MRRFVQKLDPMASKRPAVKIDSTISSSLFTQNLKFLIKSGKLVTPNQRMVLACYSRFYREIHLDHQVDASAVRCILFRQVYHQD